MPKELLAKRAVIQVASKRLPLRSRKQINEYLSCFCEDFAEAYRIGAEEAQGVIIERIAELSASR